MGELDRLMAQTVGSLQEKNMLLQERISQGLADKMRLQTNVCSLRAVLDTRSVIERCCEEYYKANRGSPGSRQSKWKSDTDRVGGFISQLILKKPGDKSPKKDFEGLLLDRPEEVRMILSQAGFKGSSLEFICANSGPTYVYSMTTQPWQQEFGLENLPHI